MILTYFASFFLFFSFFLFGGVCEISKLIFNHALLSRGLLKVKKTWFCFTQTGSTTVTDLENDSWHIYKNYCCVITL